MVYMEKRLVDSAFDEIADVVPGKERVRIKARVIRLWKVPAFLNPNEFWKGIRCMTHVVFSMDIMEEQLAT
ncbi:hypothetical protein L195_g047697 [Trifolium pratense]|uniref:Replication factor A protein n=1 Tax=Trifolium pratense TaxID=57577 RepID=A0A2K3MLA7_TRIPR|nr:hypothetical protein L195_g047697 [Trifolium pratense]